MDGHKLEVIELPGQLEPIGVIIRKHIPGNFTLYERQRADTHESESHSRHDAQTRGEIQGGIRMALFLLGERRDWDYITNIAWLPVMIGSRLQIKNVIDRDKRFKTVAKRLRKTLKKTGTT